MPTLVITADGLITLGEDMLQHLGVRPGGRIIVETFPDGRLQMTAAPPTGRISDAFGTLKREDGPLLTTEAINAITTAAWAGEK